MKKKDSSFLYNLIAVIVIFACCFLISLAYVIPLWSFSKNRLVFSIAALIFLAAVLIMTIPFKKIKPLVFLKVFLNILLTLTGVILFVTFVINEKRFTGFVVIIVTALIIIALNILWNKLKHEK